MEDERRAEDASKPLRPWRITRSWFQENAGRPIAPNMFIHRLVVRTRQSYTTASPGPSYRRQVPVPSSSPLACPSMRWGVRGA